jgi:hypothetical protein
VPEPAEPEPVPTDPAESPEDLEAQRYVLSFDIDGTLEVGDPNGPLTFAHVEAARAAGHVVGSASDRTIADQTALWEAAGVEPHFIILKHNLNQIRASYEGYRYLHIGDTDRDKVSAKAADFEFLHVDDVVLDVLPWAIPDDL